MEGKLGNLDSTAGFINYKCKKDHLNYSPLMPVKKNASLYHNDYHARQKINPLTETSNMIGKERNSPLKNDSKHVGPFGSNYRMSFENHASPKPTRMKQKSSFFLKHENYEPPTSNYQRMSTINRKGQFSTYEKAKPRSDNLSVPKYNRMNSNSVYKAEFDGIKFPLIIDRKESIHSEVSKPSYQRHKISKIF